MCCLFFFFSPSPPKALASTHKRVVFSSFSFASSPKPGEAMLKQRGAGSGTCAACPPLSPGSWKTSPLELGVFPPHSGLLPASPWTCQASFRATFITEGHSPSPQLSKEEGF